MNKTYQLISDINLATCFRLEDKSVRTVSFSGGVRGKSHCVTGTFTTGDQALQKAIEADNGFGQVFKLSATAAAKTSEVTPVSSTAVPDGFRTVKEVTNKQGALAWMAKELEMTIAASTSAEEVRNAAADNKICFVDWK